MSKKKVAILHISDLHIADNTYDDCKLSKLQVEPYEEIFIEKLKKMSQTIDLKYLLISGDVTQKGEKEEFDKALLFLNKLCKELSISKRNVILMPGNHDINWSAFVNRLKQLEVKDKTQFYKYSREKFQEFQEFYDEFFEGVKKFDPDKAVIDIVKVEEIDVLFLGINSIYRESHLIKDHIGYINEERLKEELETYSTDLKQNEVFGVLHHNPHSLGDEAKTVENWRIVGSYFEHKNINKFIHGHTHVSNASSIKTTDSIDYIGTGSLGLEDEEANTFLILEEAINDDNKKGFKPKYYGWIQGREERGYWQELSEKKDTLDFIVVEKDMGIDALSTVVDFIDSESKSLPMLEEYSGERILNQTEGEDEYYIEIKRFLLDTIKENDLYMSGHFHWSKNGRSHSFIKTNYFFENYTCVEKIKIAFLNLLNRNNVKTDLLIGYAMQGSVIGSLIAIENKWEFSYYPAIAKKHSEYEKQLPEGDYQNITVIIDLVYTDNIVKWLIKTIKKQYNSLKIINICTLFYTNCEEFNLKQYEGVQINLYYIHQIDINKCPYKDRNDCVVYKENLDNVHILYSEEEEQ